MRRLANLSALATPLLALAVLAAPARAETNGTVRVAQAPPTEVPALPPPVTPTTPAPVPSPSTTTTPPAATPPSTKLGTTEATPTTLTAEELAKLKAQIKAEVGAELKQELQAEMETAARDSANQKSAAAEWKEERWVDSIKPKLNFLQLDGYFRTRFDYFNRLDLGTFDPINGRGTSSVAPPTLYRPFDGETCVNGVAAGHPGVSCSTTPTDSASLSSTNMRLRLDPTVNISDDIRIRTTVDVLDNLVWGSTPDALPGYAANPSVPLPAFSGSQNPPQAGLNTFIDAIRLKRLWAEVMTPVGELRFGRQPLQFGLGLVANDGNKLDSDFGDNTNQVLFATRIAGHYIVPAYSVTSSGPVGRGGGAGFAGDNGLGLFPVEGGQRFNLDPKDDVHSLLLFIAKKDKEEDITEQLKAGGVVFNYGVFGVYRTQQFDIPAYFTNPSAAPSGDDYVRRNANAGIASLWGRFQWDKLKIEGEAVGIVGSIEGTGVDRGLDDANPSLAVEDGSGNVTNKPLWLLQGGAAIQSSYTLLNDQLVVGLDLGIASGDSAPGFGLRTTLNQNPRAGDFDGAQFGRCLEQNADGTCKTRDDNITNFRFDPDYHVDLILFREILGTVTDAAYVKPHVGYYLNENVGARLDVIYSHAMHGASTPGQQNPLGLEADASGFLRTDDGFYLAAAYGFFLPFGGFNHFVTPSDKRFATPQFAQTFQLYGGVEF